MKIPRNLRVTGLLCATIGLAACADSVAPGYRIEKQAVAVRYDDHRIQIRAEYRLRNTGNEPLSLLRISLAAVNPGAALDMRASVDGQTVPWQRVEQDGLPALEIRFAAPWPRKARKQLTLEYTFPSGSSRAAQAFQLLPGSWSPELLPPPGILSKGGAAPGKWELTVTVPKEMTVHSAGKPRGARKKGDTVAYRFRQEKGHGFTYVVAGNFTEARARAADFTFHFWTLQPVEAAAAQRIAERLGKTMQQYREWLGPLENDARDVWVMDGSASRYILAGPAGAQPGLAADMIIDPALFVGGQARAEGECVADEWLAGMWLYWLARPQAESRLLAENLAKHLAQALPSGCGFRLNHAQGGEEAIRRMRQAFEAANKNYQAENGRLKESFRLERDGYFQRLKVFAIEERAGRDALHRALRRVLQALKNDTWGQNELRSALETETGKEWAAFFRAWSNGEKLPE